MSLGLETAARAQRRASNPRSSAWVSANAGSGKTYVLTQRVLRLLLEGVAPSKILCLTFTKAAAANMSDRVFGRLARWTQLDDAALAAEIETLGAPKPTAVDLEAARQLFARVIDTPGGLKIQTIHAFCERVLHLFPFEANAPVGFRPLDEAEARRLREIAQARVFASADPGLAEAVARVAARVGAEGFAPLIAESARLADAFAAHGEAYADKLAARLGLRRGEDEASVGEAMREGGGGAPAWARWAEALAQGSANDRKAGALLIAAAETSDPEARLELCLQVFLTNERQPRKTIATKATTERFPQLVDELYAERDRLFALLDKRRAAAAVARSADLARIAGACERAYAREKGARSALDFDDLIAKTRALFERGDAAWVLYKLDRGVEHILVDEAQDTSEAQWSILQKLAEDFLSGAGASPSARSFFAVGDEKQSIFSFQGAQPHLFDAMKRGFARKHRDAERGFEDVSLSHSFRSAPAVLGAVDLVFAQAHVWRGVSAGEPVAGRHFPIRESLPGAVEMWPTLVGEPVPDPGDWDAPLDAQKASHPANLLADRVAAVIAGWTAPGSPERVADPETGALRPIRPGDVLVLVRSRGPVFEAMTRALRRARVASAGADRLRLSAHIAVLDVCAAARAALNPDDDLALAEVLKSPLIGLDDDALMRLAPGRKGALSAALEADKAFAAAAKRVAAWRARAHVNPFEFFARLLGEDGGRRALVGRLGPEAGDALDELLARALAHEREEAPSMSRFLAEIEAADSQIKRDMEAAGAAVRVMTAHAAKGLEAPIVILPDTHGAPDGKHDPKWLSLAPAHAGETALPVWAGAAADDCVKLAQARAEARAAAAGEHRRLLYVAMTRAAQRLIVTGYEGARRRPADCWAHLIASGLTPHMREVPSWWDPEAPMLRLGEPPRAAAAPAEAEAAADVAAPDWLERPARREVEYALAAPSRRIAGEVTEARLQRIEAGRLAHKLMQGLPALAPARRRAAAEAFLARRGEALAPEWRRALVDNALALIETPELATLFGPGSRAEIPFTATLARGDGAAVETPGRIDRLGVAADEVWIADFKTGAPVVTADYRRQLALYRAAVAPMFPGRRLRAALLWIDAGTFEELEPLTLDKAYEDWTGEAGPPS